MIKKSQCVNLAISVLKWLNITFQVSSSFQERKEPEIKESAGKKIV
jgi:hypothetical protein